MNNKCKILILIALVASVLLSGCVEIDSATLNQTAPQENIKATIKADRVDIEFPGSVGSQTFYAFHMNYDGHSYTCFYKEGGGMQENPALSCTRDLQATY